MPTCKYCGDDKVKWEKHLNHTVTLTTLDKPIWLLHNTPDNEDYSDLHICPWEAVKNLLPQSRPIHYVELQEINYEVN